MLKNAYLDAKIGVDTAENELSKVCLKQASDTHPRSEVWLWGILEDLRDRRLLRGRRRDRGLRRGRHCDGGMRVHARLEPCRQP